MQNLIKQSLQKKKTLVLACGIYLVAVAQFEAKK